MMSYDTEGGAEFYKADLHVHTPGSFDYEDEIEPEELVEEFEREGLDIVAVTDHNTTEYYDKLSAEADEASVTVLPGVEITTGQSGEHQIHVTAIFPPESADVIDGLLYDIGIRGDPEEAIAGDTIPKICGKVREEGGLPILAHIDGKAGAHQELADRNNPTRETVFDEENVAALEIVAPETSEEYPSFAHICSSDAHSVSDLGRRYTHLKMGEPSFEGLRTALADPDSRIALQREPTTHPSIDGLNVSGGFLENRHLKLNENLNCFIGEKGTGKSTALEYIRYALDIEPRSKTIQKEYQLLMKKNLGQDGEVQVRITGNNGDQYRISREYEESPKIERLTGDKTAKSKPLDIPIETFREEFFGAEIHSQRELIKLARDGTDQLDLLDSYFDIEDEHSERESVKQKLREKTREIENRREQVTDLTAKKERFDALSEQVRVMEEKGVKEYVEGQENWEHERAALSDLIDDVEAVGTKADSLDLADTIETTDVQQGPNEELLESANETLEQLKSGLNNYEEQISQAVEEAKEEIESAREEWNEANEAREQQHSKLANEIESEIDVDIDEFFEKKSELEKLRGISEELEETKEELETVKEEKEDLFDQLKTARQNLTEARQGGVSGLNDNLSNVRVSLRPQSNRNKYTQWINHVLEGSGVWTEHKEEVAEAVDPKDLAEIVRQNDTDRLVNHTDVTPTTAENFMKHDDLNEQLLKLELFEIHDRPVIELNDRGWKRLSGMSDGQQCTALLSIAMVERKVPLIIDQPEDMLDNRFISTDVVDIIRSIKHKRQIISATHNANIPILGDAEQIVVMRSNGNAGFYRNCGSIDNPEIKELAQDILEGGEDAFKRRRTKYHKVV